MSAKTYVAQVLIYVWYMDQFIWLQILLWNVERIILIILAILRWCQKNCISQFSYLIKYYFSDVGILKILDKFVMLFPVIFYPPRFSPVFKLPTKLHETWKTSIATSMYHQPLNGCLIWACSNSKSHLRTFSNFFAYFFPILAHLAIESWVLKH